MTEVMNSSNTSHLPNASPQQSESLTPDSTRQRMNHRRRESGMRLYKRLMAGLFSNIFFALALIMALSSLFNLFADIFDTGEMISTVIHAINTLVIALAMFELGAGISKEYSSEDSSENVYTNIRRTITRFVGTVCIALVLEALIMIIKYSQLDLAGNLYYPVAILFGSGVLLLSLGGFLALTRGHTE
ncbi:hypothetical protein [Saccharospirillum sp. MSK14-1]|uniref:hypothetical protein n=1 Tax=Saccharospirillum sp. MSK14-1 TaxID=1897632 RepID=UPI0018EEB5A6|nr:hypothetical protein [Saccharospirillum sp. MSK14-1]